jgi:tRNA (mo5U34)-methyltransferase
MNHVPVWFHSIDLGDGTVTPGAKSAADLASELESLRLPDLEGRSVLDIGAWDGFYSFEAERRGAARVVALDHYVWSLDLEGWNDYLERCRARGDDPRPADEVDEIWHPDTLPGKRGFDHAREKLGSRVEPMVGDFMTMDLEALGGFDVVFFFGVLYHLKDPMGALERLASVTREVAVIESEAEVVGGHEGEPLARFLETDERNNDPGNWWSPTLPALMAMCRAAGFARVEAVREPPAAPPGGSQTFRAVVHARH